MEKILEKYYKDYKIIDNLLKDRLNKRAILLNTLKNKGIDEFYFSLSKTQQEMYRKIYNDNDVNKYEKNEENITSLEIKMKNLLEDVAYSKVFPLKGNERLDIYISDGIDTYNAINNKSTKDLDIDDNIKAFIKEVVQNIFGLNENYTINDIPLIKVIIDRLKKRKVPVDEVEDIISSEVSRIHRKERYRKYQKKETDVNWLDKNIEKVVKILDLNNSRYKDLYIEESLTAYYQSLLMNKANIIDLYEQLETLDREDHICALVKAYYNLTDIEFKCNNNPQDYETANPKVNQKILDMKVSGKNV